MKKLATILTTMTISTFAMAATVENAPKVDMADALGTKKVSIKAFCMSEDQKTLTTLSEVEVCKSAQHIGHGYKKCTSTSLERVTVPNSYTVSECSGARCSTRTTTTKSYDKNINIEVYDFDPRGGAGKKVDEYTYTIPSC